MKLRRFTQITLIIFFSLFSLFSFASELTSKPEVKQFINEMAAKYRYNPSYIAWVLNKANYNPDVLKKMESPYESLPWSQYQKLFLNQERIDDGVKYWHQSNKLFAWEEKEYEVPANIILAIIGVETKYGTQMGSIRVLDALSTLAFYYPQRGKYFQSELASFILMTRLYETSPDKIYGSYAGAMGQAQFMPSSYLTYAVDFHGKNHPNLFRDNADVIFSVGNFLRQKGWEPNEPIAVRAEVKGSAYKKLLKANLSKPHPPQITLADFERNGVRPQDKTQLFSQNLAANLIELTGDNGPEFWLTFHNFYVITTYNSSDQYALAVVQLADILQGKYKSNS